MDELEKNLHKEKKKEEALIINDLKLPSPLVESSFLTKHKDNNSWEKSKSEDLKRIKNEQISTEEIKEEVQKHLKGEFLKK